MARRTLLTDQPGASEIATCAVVAVAALSACLRVVLSGRVERAALLSGGRSAAVEAADHRVDRGPADQRFGDVRVTFVVTGQAAVRGDPGQAALHHPPLRVHHETLLVSGLTDDLNGRPKQVGGPVDELAGEALISEHMPDR